MPMDPGTVSEVVLVLVTAPDMESGCILARRVVTERLAACGNVIPGLVSVYRWKGEVREDPEVLVLFKTTRGSLPHLERRVTELHSYDVPEFLVVSIAHGHRPYLGWVMGEVDPKEGSP